MGDLVFWARVHFGPKCWEYMGAPNTNGYRQMSIGGKHVLAHRWSWAQENGAIPDGMCVLHSCDNRACVRPDHLFIGTQKHNAEDRDAKGRNGFSSKTHCKHGHPFDAANTMRGRTGHRICRACHVMTNRRLRAAVANG